MMNMTGPAWLAVIFGAIMLAAAVYAAGRIVYAWADGRPTDYEVEVHHVLMGVSMAGMLIPGLGIVTAGPSTTIWMIVWVLVTIWFAVSVLRGARHSGPGSRFSGHHLPHLVMSAAMIYMLAASTAPMSKAALSSMSGMGAGARLAPWPTLDALFLVFMAGYAVLAIDRLPPLAIAVAGGHLAHDATLAERPTSFLAPRLARFENIVMALTMGYMLTMMFL
jgi:hypothetical protein